MAADAGAPDASSEVAPEPMAIDAAALGTSASETEPIVTDAHQMPMAVDGAVSLEAPEASQVLMDSSSLGESAVETMAMDMGTDDAMASSSASMPTEAEPVPMEIDGASPAAVALVVPIAVEQWAVTGGRWKYTGKMVEAKPTDTDDPMADFFSSRCAEIVPATRAMPPVDACAQWLVVGGRWQYKGKLEAAAADQAGSSSVTVAVRADPRAELLERLERATSDIGELRFLKLVVERAEAVRRDYVERSESQADIDSTLELIRKTRQPALIRQLAFYFSDTNLRYSSTLRGIISSDASSGGGYVPINKLLGFDGPKRLGCSGAQELAAAVDAAPASAGLELSSSRDAVRRLGGAAMPPTASSESCDGLSEGDERTVRISNFPKGDPTVTSEAVSTLLSSFGATNHVWLLRARGSVNTVESQCEFLGSADVEFESKEAADAALAADPSISWAGESLRLISLADFRAEQGQAKAGKRPLPGPTGEEDEATRESAKRARIEEEAVASAGRRFSKGTLLRLDEVPPGVTWREIKDAFNRFGQVGFVDHEPEQDGGRQAHVRMRDENAVSAIMEVIDKTGGRLTWDLGVAEVSLPEVMGPAGRGRTTTLPSWMTAAAGPALADLAAGDSPMPAAGGGHALEAPRKEPPSPSIPKEDNDEKAAQDEASAVEESWERSLVEESAFASLLLLEPPGLEEPAKTESSDEETEKPPELKPSDSDSDPSPKASETPVEVAPVIQEKPKPLPPGRLPAGLVKPVGMVKATGQAVVSKADADKHSLAKVLVAQAVLAKAKPSVIAKVLAAKVAEAKAAKEAEAKAAEAKAAEAKAVEAKAAEMKAAEAKAAEAKAAEAKAAEEKAVKEKAAEEKAAEEKAAEAKAAEAKAAEAEAAEAKAAEEKAAELQAAELKAAEDKAANAKAAQAEAAQAEAAAVKAGEAKATEAMAVETNAAEAQAAEVEAGDELLESEASKMDAQEPEVAPTPPDSEAAPTSQEQESPATAQEPDAEATAQELEGAARAEEPEAAPVEEQTPAAALVEDAGANAENLLSSAVAKSSAPHPGNSTGLVAPSGWGARKVSVLVVRLSADEEEAYIRKYALVQSAQSERRSKGSDKGKKGDRKGKGDGKDRKGDDRGKGGGKWQPPTAYSTGSAVTDAYAMALNWQSNSYKDGGKGKGSKRKSDGKDGYGKYGHGKDGYGNSGYGKDRYGGRDGNKRGKWG